MTMKQLNPRSVRDQIYQMLKEEIMKFRLVPGELISEKRFQNGMKSAALRSERLFAAVERRASRSLSAERNPRIAN